MASAIAAAVVMTAMLARFVPEHAEEAGAVPLRVGRREGREGGEREGDAEHADRHALEVAGEAHR